MIKKILTQFIIASLIIGMYSCNKYDDGGTSLFIKNKLCKKEWLSEKAPLLDSTGSIHHEFKRDGELVTTIVTKDSTYSINSNWELKNNNNTIQIGIIEYEIVKLTKDEFWYSYTSSSFILPSDINTNELIDEQYSGSNIITIIEKLKR